MKKINWHNTSVVPVRIGRAGAQIIHVRKGAQILHVSASSQGDVTLWLATDQVETSQRNAYVDRTFHVVRFGQSIPRGKEPIYHVGTVMISDNLPVHVFEIDPPDFVSGSIAINVNGAVERAVQAGSIHGGVTFYGDTGPMVGSRT